VQSAPRPPPARSPWIQPNRAYPGWGWVLAGAGLWLLFALLLLVLGELQREFDRGVSTRAALGYYATAAAALLVAVCAVIRRPWAHQLVIVTSAPMLLFFPIGTLVAVMAMRALFRNRAYFATELHQGANGRDNEKCLKRSY